MTETLISKPIVTGNYRVGDTIDASAGQWHFDQDYGTYEYQWQRCDANGQNCVDITGAKSSKYVLTAADKGHKLRVRVTATEHASPPPPPPPPPIGTSTAYTIEDWSTGRAETARWDRFHSYSSPGYFNTPLVASPDGRVAVVNDPAGSSKKCVRVEIRDSDPTWAAGAGLDKSEVVMSAQRTWNKPTMAFGDVRWFEIEMYFPYGSEKFEWAHGGSQPYFSMWGLHTQSSTAWSAMIMGWEAWQINNSGDKNIQLNFHALGGVFPENTYSEIINMLPLTDANGNRIMANHNRWVRLVFGMKFAPDNSGWFEGWADGKNVYPRKNRPTVWSFEDNTTKYFKYGLYCKSDASFPETGRSVAYFGRTAIGTDRPF